MLLKKESKINGQFKYKRWSLVTVLLLLFGYTGYYFCRSDLSVATPLILKEFGSQGIDKSVIGSIVSLGVLFYAVGKIFNGILADFLGGKLMLLIGMAVSIVATIVFGLGTGVLIFGISWIINRLFQSAGWGAIVKTVSNWFSFRSYGRIMGIISLSFLFGDAIARLLFGRLLSIGFGWRQVFFAAALVLFILFIINLLFLKNSPANIGQTLPLVNPKNLYGKEGGKEKPKNFRLLVLPFLKNKTFWLVALMSLGLTTIRETFNFWTPTYLTEAAGLSISQAASRSMLFPFFGGISVLLSGFLSDRVFKSRRGLIILFPLIFLVFSLLLMGLVRGDGKSILPLILISLSAFLSIGPYSFLAGAISLDLGGRRGSSTMAGLIDSAGYFGAIISGYGVGKIAQVYGWNMVFIILAIIAFLTLIVTILYWRKFEDFLVSKSI